MRRILSFLLVFATAFSILPAQAFGQEAEPDTRVETGDVTIQGTNGFGNLLSDVISEEQAEAASDYDGGYTVTDLKIQGNVATVTYDAMEEAILIVAVYTEDGLQLVTSGKTTVSPEATVATVTMEGTMPEYFQASAYLVDSYDYSPLCQAYDTPLYTREMQELLASTIHDYEADRVLNLDGDEKTNFAVFAENTVVIEEQPGVNTVISANDETMTYVIGNADEQFTSLSVGDVVAYAYGENEILIAKVANITVEGNTVTFAGSDLEMEEVFQIVKLENAADTADMTVNESAGDEGIIYEGKEYVSEYEYIPQTSGSGTVPVYLKFGLYRDFKPEENGYFNKPEDNPDDPREEFPDEDKSNLSVRIQGQLVIQSNVEFYYYLTWSQMHVVFNADSVVDIKLSISGRFSYDGWNVPAFGFMPFPGLWIGLEPQLIIRAEMKVEEVNFQISFQIGGVFTKQNGLKIVRGTPVIVMNQDEDSYLEGAVTVAINLQPLVAANCGLDLANLSLYAPVGVKIKCRLLGSKYEKTTDNADQIHNCEECLDIDISFIAEFRIRLKLFESQKWTFEVSIKSFECPWRSYYLSGNPWVFGKGECPNRSYRLTALVTDVEENMISDASLAVGEVQTQTNSNGVAVIYMPKGSYTVTASSEGLTKSGDIQINGACKVTIRLGTEDDSGLIFEEEKIGNVTDYGAAVASDTWGSTVYWELYGDGTMRIYGQGDMPLCTDSRYIPWNSYRSFITRLIVEDGVEEIGEYAFYRCVNLKEANLPDSLLVISNRAFEGCTSLETVMLPHSLREIEDNAFNGCTKLTKVTIPCDLGGYVFQNCTALKEVTILDGVTSIGILAFENCTGISEIKIPDSVTRLGYRAFRDCTGLREIVIPGSVTEIENYTFLGCTGLERVEILKGVQKIGYQAFMNCTALEEVDMAESISSIAEYAFESCTKLKEVTIPGNISRYAFINCTALEKAVFEDGVTSIGEGAFKNCTSLAEIIIPDSVNTIGKSAFIGCTSLVEIVIPKSITTISDSAFSGCTNLSGLVIPDSVTSIGGAAFSNCISLTEIEIPDTVTYLGGSAFKGTGLREIFIPSSIISYGSYTFADCPYLESVIFEDGVTSIGYAAFDGCTSLREVVIPESVTTIDAYAFMDCESLTEITLPSRITKLNTGLFRGCTSLTSVKIPEKVESVRGYVFYDCTALQEITFPSRLLSIEDYAFYDCTSLKTIIFSGNPTTLGRAPFYHVVATVYYPENNSSWTTDKMKSYGSGLTWIPYTLDENGDMIINEAAAVTAEASQEELPDILAEETEAVELSNLDVPSTDFGGEEENLNPDAVFGGDYSTEVTDQYTLKTASFTGLVPGGEYLLLAMKSIEAKDPLSADNLLFVDQAAAGEDGTLKFTYVQRETANVSYVVACGPSNKNLADAVITFPEMTADGELQVVEPTVVYDGETLVEGKDYTILGTVSFTKAGTYTCYIRGIHNYTGLVACTYTVKEAEVKNYVKWYSGTTSLNGTIDLNIYVLLSDDLVNADDTYVRFTYAGKTVDVPMADALCAPLDTAPKRYRFSCPIYAKQLTDAVNVKFMKGEQMIGKELNYSVVTYCKNRIKNSKDPAEVAICKAMLNYGAASQLLFNYNTENLANASLSDADKVLADVDASAYAYSVSGSESGIKAKSATLMLEDVVKVRVYFTLEEGRNIDDYTFTIDGEVVTPQYNDKGWYVETDGIAAKDLEKMFEVKVGGITVTYGALSYVNSKVNGSNTLESNISKALYAYWQAAEALLG